MQMTNSAVHGPIDFLLIQFPGDRFPRRAAKELLSLVDQGTIRLYDLLLIAKDAHGAIVVLDDHSAAVDQAPGLGLLVGARSGLLNDEDLAEAAGAMDPRSVAFLVVYENTWAVPFVDAALEAGGDVLAGSRIPAQDLLEVLESLEASDA